MLNISGIHEGFVLDHIKAGMSLQIYHDLKLDELDCTVAIIKNAKSSKMGKKDILKVECPIEALDLDILGFIDHNITVNVIKDDKIYEKKELHLPKQVKNVITCRNPRCITSIEQEQEIPIVQDGVTTNVLTIRDGRADMTEADCPDKLCVHQKAISKNHEMIVCLPNKVVVEVTGSEENGFDSIAR